MDKKDKAFIALVGTAAALSAGVTVYRLYMEGLNFAGPWKNLGITKITKQYDPELRKGEIIFYGGTDFTHWRTLEEDIPGFRVQNHGFGGSTDQDLMDYAPTLLYPYAPKIVVFQTSSNNYLEVSGSRKDRVDFCVNRKKKMFARFHAKLPQTRFIVLSGLLLPGRRQFLDLTVDINAKLKELCDQNDYMTFVDADTLTYNRGFLDPDMFMNDNVHLTPEARKEWANYYITPAIKKTAEEMGSAGKSLKRNVILPGEAPRENASEKRRMPHYTLL